MLYNQKDPIVDPFLRGLFPELYLFPAEHERKLAWETALSDSSAQRTWHRIIGGWVILLMITMMSALVCPPELSYKFFLAFFIGLIPINRNCPRWFSKRIHRSLRESLISIGISVSTDSSSGLPTLTKTRCPRCGNIFDPSQVQISDEDEGRE